MHANSEHDIITQTQPSGKQLIKKATNRHKYSHAEMVIFHAQKISLNHNGKTL